MARHQCADALPHLLAPNLATLDIPLFLLYIVSELWSVASESINWQWYDRLGEHYPAAVLHGLLTAAAIALLCGALGRVGFRLKL